MAKELLELGEKHKQELLEAEAKVQAQRKAAEKAFSEGIKTQEEYVSLLGEHAQAAGGATTPAEPQHTEAPPMPPAPADQSDRRHAATSREIRQAILGSTLHPKVAKQFFAFFDAEAISRRRAAAAGAKAETWMLVGLRMPVGTAVGANVLAEPKTESVEAAPKKPKNEGVKGTEEVTSQS